MSQEDNRSAACPVSPEKPLRREKLPQELQNIVDRDDGFFEDMYSP